MTESKSLILTSLCTNVGSRTHEADIVRFAEVPGDFNPVHTSSDFVKKTLFGSKIAHGTPVAGLISAAVAESLGHEESLKV